MKLIVSENPTLCSVQYTYKNISSESVLMMKFNNYKLIIKFNN